MPDRHGFLPKSTAEDLEIISRSKNPVYTFFDQIYMLKDSSGDPLVSFCYV